MQQPKEHAEGIIKYRVDHQPGELPGWADIGAIAHCFAYARAHNLIGQQPDRYQGAAYGNISQRAPAGGFVITGSQTGGLQTLDETRLCWVRRVDVQANRVESLGPVQPSSEAMTHDQVYRWAAMANFVIHVHSPAIWHQATRLGLPVTDPQAAYGTPAMAQAVEQLLVNMQGDCGALSMGGHQDGILVFGATPTLAGAELERLVEQATKTAQAAPLAHQLNEERLD